MVETLEAKREELQRQVNELNQNLSTRRTDHGVTRVKLEEAAVRQQQIRKESGEVAEQISQEKRGCNRPKVRFPRLRLAFRAEPNEASLSQSERRWVSACSKAVTQPEAVGINFMR